MGQKSNTHGFFSVLEPKEKGLLGKCGRRRENNIEMDMNESEWDSVDWIIVA
jgi:hypothetical protein